MTEKSTVADPIAAADAAAEAARLNQEQARRIREEAERQIAEAQARIDQAKRDEREAAAAETNAANDRLAAERARMADEPITKEIAVDLAERLLEQCQRYRDGGTDRNGRPYRDANRFWTELDNLRCRVRTPDVAEDARELMLTIEYVIGSCDRWERSRYLALNTTDRSESAFGDSPADDPRFRGVEGELRSVLDGLAPKPLERVGELIASQVTPDQMARMLGFISLGGVPEIDRLGAWVDRAFEAAGVERGLRRAVVQYAALDMNEAWANRQRRIESGIPDHLMPGVAEQPGKGRAGRNTPLVQKSPLEPRTANSPLELRPL